MENMYNIIEELCSTKGVNITQMCQEAAIPRATLTELKKGRTQTLGPKNLQKLSTYFEVPMEYFLGNKKTPTPENGSGRSDIDDLIELIKQADDQTLELIRRVVGYK
ncbi:MAG: helix-turn-helix domain-containing protein [Oscillospiraceae bacterium]|nr:helix-turn-helix domain-containing protein [Oscillospiraceae bacterium]